MKNNIKDEIIEELWKIKDELSLSCDKDMNKLIEKMNKLAQELNLPGEEVNLRKKSETA